MGYGRWLSIHHSHQPLALRHDQRQLESPPPGSDRLDEVGDDRSHGVRRLDELEAGQIDDDLLLDVGNAAVDDAALDDDGAVSKGQPEIVKGIECEGKAGFDLRAAAADLFDRHRLVDHYFAVKLAENLDALGVPLVFGPRHSPRL